MWCCLDLEGSDARSRIRLPPVPATARFASSASLIDPGSCLKPTVCRVRKLLHLAKAKDKGALLATLGGTPAAAAEALAFMGGHAVSRPVVVDVTSDQTTAMLLTAIKQGFAVVLANKKPIADSWESYEHLMQTAAACRRTINNEATVGAGLPIIDTFHKLDETGDRVRRIEGSVSGTLMFVLSEVSAGRAFSEAVREAVARGYAEPDPREDLSGRDAMRKALILARLLRLSWRAARRGRSNAARVSIPAGGDLHGAIA